MSSTQNKSLKACLQCVHHGKKSVKIVDKIVCLKNQMKMLSNCFKLLSKVRRVCVIYDIKIISGLELISSVQNLFVICDWFGNAKSYGIHCEVSESYFYYTTKFIVIDQFDVKWYAYNQRSITTGISHRITLNSIQCLWVKV